MRHDQHGSVYKELAGYHPERPAAYVVRHEVLDEPEDGVYHDEHDKEFHELPIAEDVFLDKFQDRSYRKSHKSEASHT